MPISLILTPFDHFQNMSSGGIGPDLILTLCHMQVGQVQDLQLLQLVAAMWVPILGVHYLENYYSLWQSDLFSSCCQSNKICDAFLSLTDTCWPYWLQPRQWSGVWGGWERWGENRKQENRKAWMSTCRRGESKKRWSGRAPLQSKNWIRADLPEKRSFK